MNHMNLCTLSTSQSCDHIHFVKIRKSKQEEFQRPRPHLLLLIAIHTLSKLYRRREQGQEWLWGSVFNLTQCIVLELVWCNAANHYRLLKSFIFPPIKDSINPIYHSLHHLHLSFISETPWLFAKLGKLWMKVNFNSPISLIGKSWTTVGVFACSSKWWQIQAGQNR